MEETAYYAVIVMKPEVDYTGPARRSFKTAAEAKLTLDNFERSWLIEAGVPENSIDEVPVLTIRDLYLDILEWGPEVARLRTWVSRLNHLIDHKNLFVIQTIADLLEEPSFYDFSVVIDAIPAPNERADWNRSRQRVTMTYGLVSTELTSKIGDVFPGGVAIGYQLDVEAKFENNLLTCLLALCGNSIYPDSRGALIKKERVAPRIWDAVMGVPLP